MEEKKYWMLSENGYIIAVGVGSGGIEIAKSEYDDIMSALSERPEETSVIGYRLKTDLTWEQYEKEPEEEPEPTSDEILNILLGGGAE